MLSVACGSRGIHVRHSVAGHSWPFSQAEIRRYEIECEGGTSVWPEFICSRVNQPAASSSPLTCTVHPGAAIAWKPIINDEGKGHVFDFRDIRSAAG